MALGFLFTACQQFQNLRNFQGVERSQISDYTGVTVFGHLYKCCDKEGSLFGFYRVLSELQSKSVHKLQDLNPSVGKARAPGGRVPGSGHNFQSTEPSLCT